MTRPYVLCDASRLFLEEILEDWYCARLSMILTEINYQTGKWQRTEDPDVVEQHWQALNRVIEVLQLARDLPLHGPNPIKNEAGYQGALKMIEILMDKESELAEKLLIQISYYVGEYERVHYPIGIPTLEEATLFRREQGGI